MFLSPLAQPRRLLTALRWVRIPALLIALVGFGIGLPWALFVAPPDYQMGEAVRIIYVHVPTAWLSMALYAVMAVCSFSALVWRHRMSEIACHAIAPIGGLMTALCLITGAIWGKPMWGAWWVWDARLTSVLILFFLYLGYGVVLHTAQNRAKGYRMGGILVLIGSLNLPIIKFSVEWWQTLHQPASLTSFDRMAEPAIAPEMLLPLLVMTLSFIFWSLWAISLQIETLWHQQKQAHIPKTDGLSRVTITPQTADAAPADQSPLAQG